MNIKNKFFIFYFFLNIILISFININNSKKVNINIFTWQSNKNSLGKLITYSYLAGITFNTLLTLIINRNDLKLNQREFDTEFYNKRENQEEFIDNGTNFVRPPERDLKESQPTISVNYRVINNNKASSSKNNKDSKFGSSTDIITDDWGDNYKDW